MPALPVIDGERSIVLLNEHWIRYARSIVLIMAAVLLYVVCMVAGVMLHGVNHELSFAVLIVGHLFLLAFHHTAFYQFLSASTYQYLFTNKRILGSRQHPWFADNVTDIPLWRIRSMVVRKTGFLQHVLNYGSIVLNNGELPTLERVPHPHLVHARLVPLIHEMQPAVEKHIAAAPASGNVDDPVLPLSMSVSHPAL